MCKASLCLVLVSVLFPASPAQGQSPWDDVLTWGYERETGQQGTVRGRIKAVDGYHAVIQRESDSEFIRIQFRDLNSASRLLLCRYLSDQLGPKSQPGPNTVKRREQETGQRKGVVTLAELYDVLNKATKQEWSHEEFKTAYSRIEGKTIVGWIAFQGRPKSFSRVLGRAFPPTLQRNRRGSHAWTSRGKAVSFMFDEKNNIATPVTLGVDEGLVLSLYSSEEPRPSINDLFRIEGVCTAKPKGNACAQITRITLLDKTNRRQTTLVYLGNMTITPERKALEWNLPKKPSS